jgi:hypothetical protein
LGTTQSSVVHPSFGGGKEETRTCPICNFLCASPHGLKIHRRMLGHAPDNSCLSCGVDLSLVTRKPSDIAHYQYYCLKCSRQRDKEYSRKYNKNPKSRVRGRAYIARLKLKVLSHYSPELRCQCKLSACWHSDPCPISDPRILCVDHVNGGGRRHLKSLKSSFGAGFYLWLKRNGFPGGFQVLCQNCNWMKVYVNHEHPRLD